MHRVTDERDGKRVGRWSVLAMLLGFAFCGYVQRTSISVAAERMTPELGLTQTDIGWLLTAFLLSYTLLQVPAGKVGERFGARWTLGVSSLLALGATVLTVVAPSLFAGAALLLTLLISRALLGVAQSPIFPVASGVIERCFPTRQWGVAQGLLTCGMNIGAALTPPAVAYLMTSSGWRLALLVTSAPLLLLAIYWLATVEDLPAQQTSAASRRSLRSLLADRDLLALSASYLSMNYVFYLLTFWCFLYFVEARGFSEINSGWLAAAPFLAAAAGAALGGRLSDSWRHIAGDRWGFRAVPLVALPISACALFAALHADSALGADLALCVAFAAIELTEGAYWSGAMQIAGRDTMPATGLLNAAGNLGGIIGTPIVAAFSDQHGWAVAFLTGSVCSLFAALLWLFVNVERATTALPGEKSPPTLKRYSPTI